MTRRPHSAIILLATLTTTAAFAGAPRPFGGHLTVYAPEASLTPPGTIARRLGCPAPAPSVTESRTASVSAWRCAEAAPPDAPRSAVLLAHPGFQGGRPFLDRVTLWTTPRDLAATKHAADLLRLPEWALAGANPTFMPVPASRPTGWAIIATPSPAYAKQLGATGWRRVTQCIRSCLAPRADADAGRMIQCHQSARFARPQVLLASGPGYPAKVRACLAQRVGVPSSAPPSPISVARRRAALLIDEVFLPDAGICGDKSSSRACRAVRRHVAGVLAARKPSRSFSHPPSVIALTPLVWLRRPDVHGIRFRADGMLDLRDAYIWPRRTSAHASPKP